MSDEISPPSWVTNEASWRKQHKRMIAHAYDLIHGRMDLVEAARELRNYKFRLRLESDNKFLIFDVIDTQTDHLPIGKPRQFWDKEALKIKDKELRSIETHYRDQALEAARNIVARYEPITRPHP